MRTHYDNLQVTRNASPEVIKGAYRFLSQKWHPDRNPDIPEEAERICKIINRAYEVLSEPDSRRKHNDWIAEQEELERSRSESHFHQHQVPEQQDKQCISDVDLESSEYDGSTSRSVGGSPALDERIAHGLSRFIRNTEWSLLSYVVFGPAVVAAVALLGGLRFREHAASLSWLLVISMQLAPLVIVRRASRHLFIGEFRGALSKPIDFSDLDGGTGGIGTLALLVNAGISGILLSSVTNVWENVVETSVVLSLVFSVLFGLPSLIGYYIGLTRINAHLVRKSS